MRTALLATVLLLCGCSKQRSLPDSPDGGIDSSSADLDTTPVQGGTGGGAGGTAGTADASSAAGSGGVAKESSRVLSVDPADGAVGVAADTKIVVQFNARMNRLSVQRAFESSDLVAADLNWSWQEDSRGDQLTITPKSPLPYADSVARTLTFAFSSQARDAQDGALVPFSSSFSLLKRMVRQVPWDQRLSGTVGYLASSNEAIVEPGDLTLGLYSAQRGFLSFDLKALFSDARAVESAELRVYQREDNYCNPFNAAGGCYQGTLDVAALQYDSLSQDLSSTPIPRDRIGTISNSWTPGWKALDVTSAVASEYDGRMTRANRAQFILFFSMSKPEEVWLYFSETPTDPGGQPELRIKYLTP